MNTLLFIVMALWMPQSPAPIKNDPTGVWQSDTGTKFEMKLEDAALKVQFVEGSSPTYLRYEVNLKNTGEPNTYEGAGFFVAKMANSKECRFDTNWTIVVVQSEVIAGSISHVVPDPETCAVKERHDEFVQFKKSK